MKPLEQLTKELAEKIEIWVESAVNNFHKESWQSYIEVKKEPSKEVYIGTAKASILWNEDECSYEPIEKMFFTQKKVFQFSRNESEIFETWPQIIDYIVDRFNIWERENYKDIYLVCAENILSTMERKDAFEALNILENRL